MKNQTHPIALHVCRYVLHQCTCVSTWVPTWPWLCGIWIYIYLCSQCLSPNYYDFDSCQVRGVLETRLYDKKFGFFSLM